MQYMFNLRQDFIQDAFVLDIFIEISTIIPFSNNLWIIPSWWRQKDHVFPLT